MPEPRRAVGPFPLRIVLTHAFCWPYVRRGTERNMDGLARYLARRGHEVFTLSTKPGRGMVEVTDAGRRILCAQRWTPLMGKLRLQPWHPFFLQSLRILRRLPAEIVHSWSFTDSLAASLTRRRGHRTVLQMNGAPIPAAYYRRFPPDRWIIREAIGRADRLMVCSSFVRDLIQKHYDVAPSVMALPIDLDLFALGHGPSEGRQTILAVADFDIRRKGVRALARAFALVHRKVPGARLVLAGQISPAERRQVATLAADAAASVEILGVVGEDLPALYGRASLMVLPSMCEPSGTVMFEAWAAGTPVVATNHGGLPEFVADDVGVLFEAGTDGEETENAEGLAEAILSGLALAEKDGTRRRCRAYAERFSWTTLGPTIESMYGELCGGG